MRWPPVTLTVGIWYLSTTSAMRRSSDALVSPPHMRGITEYVPSFWMLACARSLMKRDCGSSCASLRPRRDQVVVERGPAASRSRWACAIRGSASRPGSTADAASRIASRTSWWVRSVQPHTGFSFGRRGVVAARGRHQQLLDEARARAARRRRLGVLAHVVEREQALVLDRLDDRALAHAVAAADLGVVGHRERARLALVPGVAEVGLAEHQAVADLGDAAAVAQQLEVPRAVDGVAVQHAADELVVADHELLVDAARRIGEHDLLGVVAAGEIARGEEVDAGDLELGRDLRARVAADAVAARDGWRTPSPSRTAARRGRRSGRDARRTRRSRRCADRTSAACR